MPRGVGQADHESAPPICLNVHAHTDAGRRHAVALALTRPLRIG